MIVSPQLPDAGLDVGTIARTIGCDVALAQSVYLARATRAQLATEHGDKVRAVFGDMYGIVDL